jgi:hypothetical protein
MEVSVTIRILRSKSLIVVVVTTEDHIYTRGVQRLPKRLHVGTVTVPGSGTEQRFVKVSESADRGMLSEVLL